MVSSSSKVKKPAGNPSIRSLGSRSPVTVTGFFAHAVKVFWAVSSVCLMLAMPVVGYGFAWVGHYFFEKNRPATFQYPLWSLMGDCRMFFETISGKRRF